MKPRILIVEDEDDLRTLIEYNLSQAGFETEAVGAAWAALRAAEARPPDLVVLDLMLPDLPGTHVCRELRASAATRQTSILMLTAKGEDRDRVTGLELGADDYVVKPVSMRELTLRVQAILKRRAAGQAAEAPRSTRVAPEQLEDGPVRLDLAAHRAYLEGKELVLTPLEFRLLQSLLERAERVQSREALLEQVWEVRGDLETRTVDTHVRRLRAKLGPAADRIETVRGIGYRWCRSTERG